MSTPLELVTGILEEPRSTGSDRAAGRYEGHAVEVRFVDRGAGSTRAPYTEVVFVGALVRADLHLAVVPQQIGDAIEAAEGRGTDVIVGDGLFDDSFFVEAAPADVVKALLEPTIRARMIAMGKVGLHTREDGLCVERPEWPTRGEELRDALILGALLVARVPVAFEAADARSREGGGYRETQSAAAREAERRAEIAEVRERQRLRAEHQARVGCMIALALLVVCIVFAVIAVSLDTGGDASY